MKIIYRLAKVGDEKGIADMMNEGLKRKDFCYIGRNREMTKKDVVRYRKDLADKDSGRLVMIAIDAKNGKVIGSSGIRPMKGRLRHRVDIGWMIHPDYHGQGIGTRLVKEVLVFCKKSGFKRIDAECAIENKASWKLAKKCGFEIEGKKKNGLLTDDGKYIDTYLLGKVLK